MKFKALSTFTVPMPDQMHVFNVDAKGDLPDEIMAQYVEAGLAKPLKGKADKPEPEPEPVPEQGDDGDDGDGADGDAIIDADAPPA